MTRFNPIKDLPDLTGKVAIVTGATSGIGYAVTQGLLRKGATVYLAARNENKATATISRLQAEGLGPGNGRPVFHKAVFDDPRDAKKSAEEFLNRESRLDILVNNTSRLIVPYDRDPIGLPLSVAVNHLSPFVFTNTHLPLLKRTALLPDSDVRIVNVTSDAHALVSNIRLKDKDDFYFPKVVDKGLDSQRKHYGFTKLLNILWTRELARRLAASPTGNDGGSNILCLSVHPGWIITEGILDFANRFSWPLSSLYKLIIRLVHRPPEQGANAVLIPAAAQAIRDEASKYHGQYLVPYGKLGPASKDARDDSLAKDLWDLTERVLIEYGL
ncbi:NAD-binding protein [Fomitiporia mediterranea MF3/22]|uniref:NAD-binding protein n=1 Tax=Fomitiporia mediterranea (strain MF3/22) TaxID=694068 RepID=UPI00044086D6|nr:NAD-binding protein [Fomitiporia mediterranea MF3/22]EJC97839.1 NAD-binding protein [Fomitiporia mediterranea MF3/22]